MQVFVKTLTGRTISLMMDESSGREAVAEAVKAKLTDSPPIPRDTGAQPMCDGAHNQVAVDAEGRLLPCRNTAVVEPGSAPVSSAQLALG
jgi:hypothetical protein